MQKHSSHSHNLARAAIPYLSRRHSSQASTAPGSPSVYHGSYASSGSNLFDGRYVIKREYCTIVRE
jgi:hypothetical protein